MSNLAKFGAAVALLLTLLCAGVTSAILYDRFEQTNRNRAANAAIWHAVICDIEKQLIINRDGEFSAAKRKAALRFYDNLLVKDAHAAPCGLYPGGKQ